LLVPAGLRDVALAALLVRLLAALHLARCGPLLLHPRRRLLGSGGLASFDFGLRPARVPSAGPPLGGASVGPFDGTLGCARERALLLRLLRCGCSGLGVGLALFLALLLLGLAPGLGRFGGALCLRFRCGFALLFGRLRVGRFLFLGFALGFRRF